MTPARNYIDLSRPKSFDPHEPILLMYDDKSLAPSDDANDGVALWIEQNPPAAKSKQSNSPAG